LIGSFQQEQVEQVLTIKELNNEQKPTGRYATFTNVEFLPLQYSDLIETKLTSKFIVPLSWKNARVVKSNISEISVDDFASAYSSFESSYTSRGIALVKGGWLPCGFAIQGRTMVFPDRCIVTAVKQRFQEGLKKNEEDKDFLDFLSTPGIRLNPSLFVVEGNMRQNPNPKVIKQQFKEVIAVLRSALPQAKLFPRESDSLKGIIGITQDTKSSIEKKQDFLLRLAPKLQPPTSVAKKDGLWEEILLTAQDFDIPNTALVVIAALSAISLPQGTNPSKQMLKLKNGFTKQDAYNALADIRSLEILMHLFALHPDEHLALLTADRNLALFWSGLQVSNLVWIDNHLSYKLSPFDILIPKATEAQKEHFFSLSARSN